jgi:hypothetical protein
MLSTREKMKVTFRDRLFLLVSVLLILIVSSGCGPTPEQYRRAMIKTLSERGTLGAREAAKAKEGFLKCMDSYVQRNARK